MTDGDRIKDAVLEQMDEVRPEAERLSAEIHAHPELGFEEVQASEWLTALLDEHGFRVDRGVADIPTAFRASYRGGDGPVIALLAEYDALPGVGHGCGHNLICTASSAAAIALRHAWPDLPGEIVVMGTPAEEGGGGKILMIDRGVFEGVDVSMMFHPNVRNSVNNRGLAMGHVDLTFTGRPAHSAVSPWLGRNAADAAMLFFAGVNALRQHVKPDARLHGVIVEAGDRANIVPKRSHVEFMVRARLAEDMEAMMARVLDIARGAALMTGTELDHRRGLTYLDYRHSATLGGVAEENFARLAVPTVPVGPETPAASGDGGNVSHVIPHLGFSVSISETPIPGHSDEWREAAISPMGQEAMAIAARVMGMTCVDILTRPELLPRIREEHRAALAASANGGR